MSRIASLALACALLPARAVAAEKQLKPFIAVTFGGDTTFVNLQDAAGEPHLVLGVGTTIIWEVVGLDVDVAHFGSENQTLASSSGVTTVTGNLVVTLPRRMTEYTLRPYFVGGGGLMHLHADDFFSALTVSETLGAFDLGGGVTGFITNRVGVSWEARRFRSLRRNPTSPGVTFGPGKFSFWRASMAVAIRY